MSGIISDISSRLGINAASSAIASATTSGASAPATTTARESSVAQVTSRTEAPSPEPTAIEEPTSISATVATTTAAPVIETTTQGNVRTSVPAVQPSVTKNSGSTAPSASVENTSTSASTSDQQAGSQQDKSSSTLFITFGVILAIILGVIVITFIIRKCFLSESSNIRNRRLRRASTHKPALPVHSSSALGLITPNSSRPPSKDVIQTIPRRSSRTSFMSHNSSVASIGRMPPPIQQQQQQQMYAQQVVYPYPQQYAQYPPQQPSGLQYEAYAGGYPAPVYMQQAPQQFGTFESVYGQPQQQQQHFQQQQQQQQQ
ncbi:hypothetical protein HDU78_010499 [Chytriomyces hyalinus]|nr:hypothetical protein HDU78_010499 [Chytriomyces hyalinus]